MLTGKANFNSLLVGSQRTRTVSITIDKSKQLSVMYRHLRCVYLMLLLGLCSCVDASHISTCRSSRLLTPPARLSYSALSATAYAHARSMSDAAYLLPYPAGSAPRLARSFADTLITTVTISTPGIIGLLGGVCALGAVSALWVPRLPGGIPRRGTGVFSWGCSVWAGRTW